MTVNDKHIKEVWENIIEKRPDNLPSEEELQQNLHFSKTFPEQKTKNLPKKFFYISGKTVSKALVYILILLLFTGSITVYAVVQIIQWHINEKNTDISLDMNDTNHVKIQDRYFPTYIPEDYHEAEKTLTDNSTITRYIDGIHNIYFRQELPTGEGSFDNENTSESIFTINGAEAVYFSKNREKTLIFSEFNYVFYIDTDSEEITKEQLTEIAKSIKKER